MQYDVLHLIPWVTGTFWVFVAVAVFAILAGRKILGAVGGLLDARTEAVKAALAEAAQLKAEAEALLADAKTKPEPELQFEPDAQAGYDTAAHVLNWIKASGVTKFGFVGNEQYAVFVKAPGAPKAE